MTTTTIPVKADLTSKVKGRILPPLVTGQEYVLIGIIVALWALLGVFTPAFLTAGSVVPLLVAVAPVALVGVGMTFVIITAGIDVSVGAATMVAAVVVAKAMVALGLPLIPAVLLAMAVGGVLGFINGVLIAYGRIHPIIITFGTANLFMYLGLQIFGSSTVNNIPSTFAIFGRGEEGRTMGIPHSFVITLIVLGAAWWFLRHRPSGRHLLAIGGNENAARLAGVKVKQLLVSAYTVTGLLIGLGACFTLGMGTSTLDQGVGVGRELAVIAAVVIGGTSVLGGRGSVLGTLLGAILVQTVTSGVTQLGWPSQLSDLFVGLAIILAVGTDIIRERARKKTS